MVKKRFYGARGSRSGEDGTLSQFDMHPLSEDPVLTTYRIFDEDKVEHTLRSLIWKCTNGRWQMFFHQGTKTKGPR